MKNKITLIKCPLSVIALIRLRIECIEQANLNSYHAVIAKEVSFLKIVLKFSDYNNKPL